MKDNRKFRPCGPLMSDVLKEVQDKITDLEWEGKDSGHLHNELSFLIIMRDNGDTYVPTF